MFRRPEDLAEDSSGIGIRFIPHGRFHFQFSYDFWGKDIAQDLTHLFINEKGPFHE